MPSAISGYINTIRNAVYGEQVRTAIVNALNACYSDVNNPSLNTEAFSAAIEAAYADGFLDIQEKSTIAGMTNQKIIYRYTGNETGYINNALYYYDGSAWVPIGASNDIEDDLTFESVFTDWEVGSMSGASGEIPALGRSDRIRTVGKIPAFSNMTIAEGYRAAVLAYEGDSYIGVLTSNGYRKTEAFTWYTGTVSISLNNDYSYVVVLAKSSDAEMSASDGSNATFTFYSPSVFRTYPTEFFPRSETESGNTAQECIDAFVSKMNKKASLIGMTGSTFANPSGILPSNTSTAEDMVRLGIACCGNDKICRVWNKRTYTVTTKNETPKNVTLTSTVHTPNLDNYYYLFGGKTGAIPNSGAYALVAACGVEGKIVVGAVGGAHGDTNRFVAMRQLMDIAKTIINGGTNSATVTAADYAACAVLPNYNPNLYEQYPLEFLYSQGGDTAYICASNTKCLSMLVMLDLCPDINQTIKFIASDAIGGTGAVFATGDIITYEDALYAAMLPSSNMAVQAVARTLGQKILSNNL